MNKVLLITDSSADPLDGGTERHTLLLGTGLAEMGYIVDVIQLKSEVQKIDAPAVENFKLLHIPIDCVYSLSGILSVLKILYFIRSKKYNCIISFFEISDIISALCLKLLSSVKIKISSRRDTGFRYTNRIKKIYPLLNRRFDYFVAASVAVQEYLLVTEKIAANEILLIQNGVPVEEYKNINKGSLRAELGLSSDQVLFGCIANLFPVKNHKLMLRSFAKLRKTESECALILVGDGPLRNELELYAQSLSIHDHVYFLGNRTDIPGILNDIDIFVLSSDTEGMSNAILEAMAARKPVIATRVGGNPEVVEDGKTGILVANNSPDDLCHAMLTLIGSEDLRVEYGDNGYLRVAKEFSNQVMLEKYSQSIAG